ncbi:MAG TPA: HAD-IA family hydrolase [Candidatus Eremiobacteraceae bacterium]|nr:HAD-IA family hydrolase [Candidatus Eremiobacteraceae bacterium]
MIRKAPRPLRVVLFDLDGTLIDSTDLIVDSYVHTYRTHGRIMSGDQIRAELGLPLHDTLARYFRGDELKAATATYLAYNLARHDEGVRKMAGVVELVRRLRDLQLRLGVVTSKVRETARRGLTLCHLDGMFEALVAKEETRRHKPDSEPLLYALALLEVDADETAYVGDSPLDVEAADGAGVRSVAALWRPVAQSAFAGIEPDAFAQTPGEAADILEAWRDGRSWGRDEGREEDHARGA